MGSRQHQVPHHHTALQHAVFIKAHRPHLPEHLPQGLGRHGKIIRRSRIPGGKRAVVIFQVGQVDLHPALQQPQHFHPLVPAGIIQYRDRQAFAAQVQCFQDPRQILRGGNQIDIVRPLRLQCKENFRQPFGGDLFPLAPVTDDAILTKNTAQRTSAEKHRPGAPFGVLPADAGLLPAVEGGPGGAQGIPRPAAASLGTAVRPAAAGT